MNIIVLRQVIGLYLMPPMLQPRKDPRGVLTIGSSFYIAGGIDYQNDCENENLHPNAEKYDPKEEVWQDLLKKPWPHPVDHVVVTTLHNHLYLIGGLESSQAYTIP